MGTGRPCKACGHDARAEIDAALVKGFASLADLSRTFAVSQDALARHRDKHLPTEAMREGIQAVAAAEGMHGASLAQEASSLRARALALLSKAEKAGDLRTALAGVREACRCVELSAKLAGEIDTSATVNIAIAPQWVHLQTVILQALAPHPAARLAVAAALEGAQ